MLVTFLSYTDIPGHIFIHSKKRAWMYLIKLFIVHMILYNSVEVKR
jgi:hypothetical protein